MPARDMLSAPDVRPLIDAPETMRIPTSLAANSADDCSLMPISTLLPADSPRLAGEDMQHARLLADSDAELPPILVHRKTMRVIDGMHRIRAAVLRGEDKIKAKLFDGCEEAAFVLAVEAN